MLKTLKENKKEKVEDLEKQNKKLPSFSTKELYDTG